jgi:hypothetical protein
MTAPRSTPSVGVRQLFVHVFEQRALIAVIVVLSLVSAAIALAQPLLVGRLIQRVGDQEPLRRPRLSASPSPSSTGDA